MDPELLRVSVLVGGRRTDLAVPVGLPVAELLPLLVAGGAGRPGGDPAAGPHLTLPGGPALDPELPLERQGVGPGAVLVVTTAPAAPSASPQLDDPAEALAVEVARAAAVTPGQGHVLRLTVATLLGLLAAAGTARLGGPAGGLLGAAGAVALLGLGAWLSRSGRPGAVPAALLACLFAAAATTAVAGAPVAGTPVRPWLVGAAPAVGSTVVVTAMAGAVALARRRALLLAAAVPGAVLIALGLLARGPGEPAALLAVLATVLVVLGGPAPGVALSLVGLGGEPLRDPYADPGDDEDSVDGRDPADSRDRADGGDPADGGDRADGGDGRTDERGPFPPALDHLARDAARAGDLLAGAVGGVGVVLVLAAPVLAVSGRAAAALAGVLALHLVLQARRSHAALLVAAQLGPGVLGLVGVLGVLLVREPAPGSAPPSGLVLVVVLALVPVVLLLLPAPASPVGRRRAGDVAETLTTVALLPLLAVVTGLLDAVSG